MFSLPNSAVEVSRESLSTRTKRNLEALEERGFTWGRVFKDLGGPGRTISGGIPEYGTVRVFPSDMYAEEEVEDIFNECKGESVVQTGYRSFSLKDPDRFSFYVEGEGPEGEAVWFLRKETPARGAGQTYLVTPYGNIQLSTFLSRREFTPKHRTSRRAYDKYLGGK